MPIKLFARMRMRRGLKVDLGQLLGSEFGHAVDTQELFIGNGTVASGAPEIGNTQILTEYSDNPSIIEYTYKSNTQEIPNTGPTVRTLQQVLDDSVSIKAFPVLGDNSNDDSAGFNLAMLQIYCNGGNPPPVGPAAESFRRKIFMPAGKYRMIANELIIPSRAHIIGEGKFATVIHLDSTSSMTHLFRTADSLGQTGTNIGTNSAELPTDIVLENMSLVCDSYIALARLERASNITFKNCYISLGGIIGSGTAVFDVTSLGAVMQMENFVFDSCEFGSYSQIFNFNPSYQVSGQTNVSNIQMPNCVFNDVLPNFDNKAIVDQTINHYASFSKPNFTILASQTNKIFLTLPISTIGNSVLIDYSLVVATALQIGRLSVISDGTNIFLNDENGSSAATGVTFSAAISSGDILIQYTSGVRTPVMRYSVKFTGNT
jgi:hypothetical protein